MNTICAPVVDWACEVDELSAHVNLSIRMFSEFIFGLFVFMMFVFVFMMFGFVFMMFVIVFMMFVFVFEVCFCFCFLRIFFAFVIKLF